MLHPRASPEFVPPCSQTSLPFHRSFASVIYATLFFILEATEQVTTTMEMIMTTTKSNHLMKDHRIQVIHFWATTIPEPEPKPEPEPDEQEQDPVDTIYHAELIKIST
jgi:hypothetical protein